MYIFYVNKKKLEFLTNVLTTIDFQAKWTH